MGIRSKVAKLAAPSVAGNYVRSALERAIDGVGPLRPVNEVAERKLADAAGDVEKAIDSIVRSHTTMAGIQGFVTNLGGIAALALSVPTNVVGVTLVQCHMVAAIAHLRGYPLDDPRTRNAILACLLGADEVSELIDDNTLPADPMGLATAPGRSDELDRRLSTEVTKALVGRTAGRRAVTAIGRRIPFLGGAVGASSDAWSTYQIATYATEQLRNRRSIQGRSATS